MKAKLQLENDLRDVVSRLISQVSIAAKQTRTDINLASEDAWIPILREVFHAQKLDNLNRHQKNFPGIDLGDTENRICFQVTATTDIEKVKKTVSTFVEKKYFNTFDDLYIFILTKRQKTYSQESINKIIGSNNFSFSTKEHIIDPEVIVEKIGHLRFATQERLLRELKTVAGDIDAKISSLETDDDVPYNFASNLINFDFPNYVYTASLDFDLNGVWETARNFGLRMPRKKTTRACVFLSLELAGFPYTPFTIHENKVFTFENLEKNTPFSGLLDEGTIEPITTDELYSNKFVEYQNVFKHLLKSTLRSKLQSDAVTYSHKEKLFYFMPSSDGDVLRKVTWKDKRKATRTVYEQILSTKDSSKVYAHRHFAFDITFTSIQDKWFGVIYPSWIFTSNLRRKHRDNHNLVTSKKSLEKNHSVRDHVRFIASYLSGLTNEQNSLLNFSGLIEFELNHKEIVDLSDEGEEE